MPCPSCCRDNPAGCCKTARAICLLPVPRDRSVWKHPELDGVRGSPGRSECAQTHTRPECRDRQRPVRSLTAARALDGRVDLSGPSRAEEIEIGPWIWSVLRIVLDSTSSFSEPGLDRRSQRPPRHVATVGSLPFAVYIPFNTPREFLELTWRFGIGGIVFIDKALLRRVPTIHLWSLFLAHWERNEPHCIDHRSGSCATCPTCLGYGPQCAAAATPKRAHERER